ncbi:MAG: hypothetical protein R3C44_05440 [Chloroflexota bacterium]
MEPYAQSVHFLVDLANELRKQGVDLDYLDVGGGLGISYESSAPSIREWAGVVAPTVWDAGYELVMEPGRSIVGPGGLIVDSRCLHQGAG